MSDTDITVTISDATDINITLDDVGLAGSSGTSPDVSNKLGAGVIQVSGTSGTMAIDFALGNGFIGTLGTSGIKVTFSNPTEGQVYRIMLKQGTTGGFSATSWPQIDGSSGFWLGGGTAGSCSTAANARDVVTLWYADGVYLASFLNK